MEELGEKQQQKIPDPGFFCNVCHSFNPISICWELYYRLLLVHEGMSVHESRASSASNKQNTQLNRGALKSGNVFTPVTECSSSHISRPMIDLFLKGDYRDKNEDLVRHLL